MAGDMGGLREEFMVKLEEMIEHKVDVVTDSEWFSQKILKTFLENLREKDDIGDEILSLINKELERRKDRG